MSTERMQWTFEVLDRISAPSRRMDAALGQVEQRLRKTQAVADKGIGAKFTRMLGGASSALGGGASAIGEAASILAGPVLAIGAVTGGLAVASGKWMLDSLRFKEDTLAGFKAMLGSKQKAEEVFSMATKFAAATPFRTDEVVGMANKLLTSGFKQNELENLMKGVGDVGALLGNQKMDSVISALAKLRNTGKVTQEAVNSLADAGINMRSVYEALGKQLGGKTVSQVEKLISAGKVTGDMGVKAAMDTIASTLSGGKLGGAMAEKSKTLSGLISTLLSQPQEILFALGPKLEPMIAPLKTMVEKVSALLDPSKGAGGKLLGDAFVLMGRGIGAIAGAVASFDFAGWIAKIRELASRAGPLIERFFAGFGKAFGAKNVMSSLTTVFDKIKARLDNMDPATLEKVGTAVGYVALGVLKLFEYAVRLGVFFGELIDDVIYFWVGLNDVATDAMHSLESAFSGIWQSIKDMFRQAGVDSVGGLIEGLLSMVNPAAAAALSIGDSLIGAVKSKLGIASPSQVFADLGMFTGEGFLQGLGASGMNQAIANPLQPSQVVAGAAGLAAGVGQSFTVHVASPQILVQGTGKNGNEIAKEAASSFSAHLASALKGFATEAGR